MADHRSERRGAHVRWLETLFWPESAVNFTGTNDCSVEQCCRAGERAMGD